jgi:putative acetyltransferase
VIVEIRRADPRAAAFRTFLQASDDYAAALYPAESNHMLDIETLLKPKMRFFGLFMGGDAKGCGGYWAHDGYAEVKRVWIDPSARGLGLARKLMAHIEDEIRRERFTLARLETGISQPEALGLYHALGYARCGPFGDYRPDPLSVFMEKRLSDQEG